MDERKKIQTEKLHEGYLIKLNPDTGRWEIFWRERKQKVDFARAAEAEEWIDDQIPSHRF